ncbi:MAG: alpha/beta hydrolase domain-containing protein [Wenzhouxiangellaceae bacterium]
MTFLPTALTHRQLFGMGLLLLNALAPLTTSALELEALPVDDTQRPFFSALEDLHAVGYSEDEYLISGAADVYQYTTALDIEVQTTAVPYTTRMLIRRPTNPQRFNGVVVFEMLNPTAGFDADFMWKYTSDLLIRRGYIWVGVTIRDNAANFLKFWNPQRYATIDIPDRGVSYGMYGQVATLLKDTDNPDNPLSAYDVELLLGAGYSQSDDWITTFSNEFHHQALINGEPAFDGYLTAGGNAAARAINSNDSEFYPDERRYNVVDAPYFRVQSETELDLFSFPANLTRQPDSITFRQWEVPGATHADGVVWQDFSATIQRDLGAPLGQCDNPQSNIALGPYIRSALHHLTRWAGDGIPPPASQYIAIAGNNQVLRDVDGNALGGIRTPDIAAPAASYLPFNSGPGPCIFSGAELPFSAEQLAQRYPNHGHYIRQVVQAANQLRRDGYLLPADAREFKRNAAHSTVGQ